MQRIPVGRVRLGLTPCPEIAAFTRTAWPSVPGPVDVRVRLRESPTRFSVHMTGPALPIIRHTARAAAWFGWPSATRSGLAWEDRGGHAVLRHDNRTVARLWARTLHLDRRHFAAEAALDTGLALAMASQPERIFLHSALLDSEQGAVGLTGVSAAGKTTLSTDLAASGWRPGTDELFGLDPDAGDAWPVPRAPIERVSGRLPFTEAPAFEPRRVTTPLVAWPAPRPMHALLVLERFGDRASIRPLDAPTPTLFQALLDSVSVASSWGLEPARHGLRIARLLAAFQRIRLGALTVGPREETAQVVRQWIAG